MYLMNCFEKRWVCTVLLCIVTHYHTSAFKCLVAVNEVVLRFCFICKNIPHQSVGILCEDTFVPTKFFHFYQLAFECHTLIATINTLSTSCFSNIRYTLQVFCKDVCWCSQEHRKALTQVCFSALCPTAFQKTHK